MADKIRVISKRSGCLPRSVWVSRARSLLIYPSAFSRRKEVFRSLWND